MKISIKQLKAIIQEQFHGQLGQNFMAPVKNSSTVYVATSESGVEAVFRRREDAEKTVGDWPGGKVIPVKFCESLDDFSQQ